MKMSEDSTPGKRISKRQIQILVIAWAGISAMVVALVFLAMTPAAANGAATVTLAESAPTDEPVTAEAVAVAIPVENFGYGVQVRSDRGDPQVIVEHTEVLGVGWIKQQVRWEDFEPSPGMYQWEWLDGLVAVANDAEVKVMLSILAAPDWSRTIVGTDITGPPDNPQDYVNFVVTLLERYPGQVHAIEVWNEQNLLREWSIADGLSAERYLEMLRLTYDAIKRVDPGIIVISGALAPTGVNDGVTAIGDFEYLSQMIEAGLLESADCIGAHHTGINLPPDVTAEEAFAGGAPAGTMFLGPYDTENPLNPHHSWSLRSTLQGQYDIIVAAGGRQRLCVTQFGWASIEGLEGEAPADFDFAWDNSLEEQAEYAVQAYQLLREWGIAEMAFLWNLDFAPKSDEGTLDDKMLYSILAPDGTPRPAYAAIAAMPKN